jgi:Biotin-protein ligase, N terminal
MQVDRISAEELREGAWLDGTRVLVMPGGADQAYCDALNGAGNRHIRRAHLKLWHARHNTATLPVPERQALQAHGLDSPSAIWLALQS